MGQTPLSEKLHNETSVDRVTTYFQNRQRKDCIILLLKSTKIISSSNFSQLPLSTALLLKQKKNKIPGFYIACTSEDPQAMESAWDKRINLFYRFWEVHSKGKWEQPAEKKTRDQNLMSKSQVITKNVNKIANFLLLKNSKPLNVKLFPIGSVNSCVQTAGARKTTGWKKVVCRSRGIRVSKSRSTIEEFCSSACPETYSLWKLSQTPHNEKLPNDTSVDRVTTFSKSTTERLYFFVVKIYQNQIELQLFSVAIVNGSTLEAEEKKSWFL